MFRDVTLGQYYQVDSPIHRLDPRVKFVGTFIYMLSLFIFNNIFCYALAALFLVVVIALTRVPVGYMFKGMRAVLFIMLFTVICNLFMTPGDYVWQFGFLHISREGIKTAILMVIRLTLLISSASIMTLTTTPQRLTDGMERLFAWMKIFRIPVHEMAMMMSIALRFIPILAEESDKIIKARVGKRQHEEKGKAGNTDKHDHFFHPEKDHGKAAAGKGKQQKNRQNKRKRSFAFVCKRFHVPHPRKIRFHHPHYIGKRAKEQVDSSCIFP